VVAVRVQKILAEAGLASRREAERWIQEGRVQVNGKVVALGARADPEKDSVRVDGKRVRAPEEKTYILLNKPKGYVTTVSDPESRDTVMDLLPENLRRGVKPVGRLDVQTEGLLLLTDDGDLARLVTHPSSGCRKEYRVKVSGVPDEKALKRLRTGVSLDGRRTLPCEIDLTSTTGRKGEGNAWLTMTLAEGRTRQIRRMFESVRHPVSKLKRVAIGPIRDDRLPPGGYRPLARGEIEALRRSLRAKLPSPPGRGGGGEGLPLRRRAPSRRPQ
jgi:23S rRNA pseudouridine2605 synthase